MKKNAKKITIITVILVILILLLIQIIQLIPKNKQSETQEVIQTSNNEKEEVLAETSVVLNAEQKKQFMEELSVGWDDSKVEKVNVKLDSKSETEEIPIPVPKGYKISGVEGENTLDGGVVIYEGTDEVSGESDSEGVKTAQKTRNQWVWVPVYDPNEIYGVDANGKMWGKLYNYSTSGGTKDNWSETDGVIRISSSSNDREPDVVTGYDKDDYLPNYLSQEDRADLDNELTTNFENSIKSIKKYGGFYIDMRQVD